MNFVVLRSPVGVSCKWFNRCLFVNDSRQCWVAHPTKIARGANFRPPPMNDELWMMNYKWKNMILRITWIMLIFISIFNTKKANIIKKFSRFNGAFERKKGPNGLLFCLNICESFSISSKILNLSIQKSAKNSPSKDHCYWCKGD